MKQFSEWNTLKENLNFSKKENFFKERDIFWVNIGYEQDGKGEIFSPLVKQGASQKDNCKCILPKSNYYFKR